MDVLEVLMRTLLLAVGLGLAVIALAITSFGQRGTIQALTGTVSSAEESRMEGVLVSAKHEGSNRIVTVVSNAEGVYSFPRNRLEPGRYDVSIRAVGYVLPGSVAKVSSN